MIGAIATRLIGWGVAERWARPIAWALVLVLAGLVAKLAWSHWLGKHDAAVVSTDRNAATVQVLGNVIEAEREAGAKKDARDRAFAAEQSNLQEKADAAAGNGASPLDAVFDGMR